MKIDLITISLMIFLIFCFIMIIMSIKLNNEKNDNTNFLYDISLTNGGNNNVKIYKLKLYYKYYLNDDQNICNFRIGNFS